MDTTEYDTTQWECRGCGDLNTGDVCLFCTAVICGTCRNALLYCDCDPCAGCATVMSADALVLAADGARWLCVACKVQDTRNVCKLFCGEHPAFVAVSR